MFETSCTIRCRYVTELPGGVMEPSDDDPVYEKVCTTDLAQLKESTNLTWPKIATALDPRFKDLKCLPKDERSEVWASVRDLVMGKTHTQQPPAETTEKLSPKKMRTSILLRSSDTDTDEEEEPIEHCPDRYKAELKMDVEDCPLQWWSKREGAHARLAPITQMYLSTPSTTVPRERLFSLSGHIIQKKQASLSLIT